MSARERVLLLPGLLCDDWVWHEQVDALADVADAVIADLSAFDDLGAMATASLRMVDDGDRRPVHVIGHSMGGRVALEIWRQAPHRVRSLVLMDTGVHGVEPGEVESRQVLLDLAATDGMDALARAWLPRMVHPDRLTDHAVMGPLREMVLRASPEQHVRQIHALVTRPDATELLGTITVPTLVVVGRQDAWSPLTQHEMIADAIGGARLEIVEESGHMITVERPAEVSALLHSWVRERSA